MSEYLTRKELAQRWGRSYGTLANWALSDKGPTPTRRSNGTVRYRLTDIEAWEAEHDMTTD